MDKFQEQLMINNLEANDMAYLPLDTILNYVESINTSGIPDTTKKKYIAKIRDVMTSVRRSPTDTDIIAKIAFSLHKYGSTPYG